MLTAHFSETELGVTGVTDPVILKNAQQTAELLERVRTIVRVPFRGVSGYRSVAENTAAGGARNSQHLDATAGDFTPKGITLAEFMRRFNAGEEQVGGYGQLILYPYSDGHVHLSLPTRAARRQKLIANASESEYFPYAGSDFARLVGGGAGLIILLLVILALYFSLRA